MRLSQGSVYPALIRLEQQRLIGTKWGISETGRKVKFYALTKAGGMRHVYEYYLGGYKQMSLAESKKAIHLLEPYDNQNCRQCHTATLHDWRSVPDHESLKRELYSNKVSCASAGCHGYAHPFTKPAEKKAP